MKLDPTLATVGLLTVVFIGGLAMAGPASSDPGTVPLKREATVGIVYPRMASGVLTYASLADLPDRMLLKCGQTAISEQDIKDEIAKSPEKVREQLGKSAFFMLEQKASRKLLAQAAKNASDGKGAADEGTLIRSYLKGVVGKVSVTDAEVRNFYKKNPDMFGGATFDQVKTYLRRYLVKEKQQAAVVEHLRSFGKRTPIQVSAAWVKEQAPLMRDNPVDKARASGRPSMVDFGRHGCGPCDMMTPILKTLRKKLKGRANILFVHVGEEQILAARYGVRSIPVQVFFGKDGKEVARHTGFFPQDRIEKRLAQMGVK